MHDFHVFGLETIVVVIKPFFFASSHQKRLSFHGKLA